jgi:uncharacterized protein (TIRG00374 family)
MTVTGLDVLLTAARALSWRIVVIVVFPHVVVALLHTLAWRCLFQPPRVSLGRLFGVRLAGEALNAGTASVGGEPVKAYLLRPWVSFADACTALVVEKTSITVAQVLFLALGLAVAIPLFELPADFLAAMWALLGLQVVAVGGFALVQMAGVFGWTLRLLERCGVPALGSRRQGLLVLDRSLVSSYTERWGTVVTCVLVHLLGWVAGSFEVYLVLRWLDVRVSFTDALVIDAFGTGVKFLAFAIPGALGVLEGGFMVVFGAIGLGSGLGLSFTLIRRLRMVAWSALGVLLLALLRGTSHESSPGASGAGAASTMPSPRHRAASGS